MYILRVRQKPPEFATLTWVRFGCNLVRNFTLFLNNLFIYLEIIQYMSSIYSAIIIPLTDCWRFGSACELSSSSAISEFPSSQHNIRADSPP